MSMPKDIQAKDIDEDVLLAYLRRAPGEWHFHLDPRKRDMGDPTDFRFLHNAFPGVEIPEKVLHAKLSSMLRRGLIHGCSCGCRGDWHVDG